MFRVGSNVGYRNLMGAPEAFELMPVQLLWRCPSLRRTQNDEWPAHSLDGTATANLVLNSLNPFNTLLHSGGHFAVHYSGIVAFDEERRPAKAEKKIAEFLRFNSG